MKCLTNDEVSSKGSFFHLGCLVATITMSTSSFYILPLPSAVGTLRLNVVPRL